jgi:hypothetical protein
MIKNHWLMLYSQEANMKNSNEELKKRIKSLRINSQITFAWRTALRALPFLGINGIFNQWTNMEKVNYLTNRFHALDIAIAFVVLPEKDISYYEFTSTDGFYGDEFFEPDAKFEYIGTGNGNDKSPAIYTEYLVYAVDSLRARNKTGDVMSKKELSAEQRMTGDFDWNGMYVISGLEENFDSFIYHTITSAAYAPNFDKAISEKYLIKFHNVILDDLSIIENNAKIKQHSLVPFYDEIWDNFQQLLKGTHWAQLFTGLFEKNLVLDDKDINELRVRI